VVLPNGSELRTGWPWIETEGAAEEDLS
jgi:hypothetical protein